MNGDEEPVERGGTRRAPRRRPDQLPAGRHGLSADEVAASQRNRIVAAMTEEIGRDGYHATVIANVIKRAGVSRRTFYTHFPDKEACLIVAYRQAIDDLLAVTTEAFRAQDEWADQVRAGLSALLHALARRPAVARMCFVEVMTAGPKAVAARNEAMHDLTFLFQGARLHGDRPVPAAFALNMVGGLNEIVYRHVAAGETGQLPTLLPELMYTAVLPFLGPEAAERELERGQNVR